MQFTERKGSIKISHKWMGFTQRQDLKLSAGLDVCWPTNANESASVSKVPASLLGLISLHQ